MTTSARLNPTDEMLVRAELTVGSTRVVQLCRQLDMMPSAEALQAEWAALNATRLSRVVREPRIPGARRAWRAADNPAPVRITDGAVADTHDAVVGWLDEQIRYPLGRDADALWLLAATPCGSGGLVSLTVPHFRCDGQGVFAALQARSRSAATARPRPSRERSHLDDVLDDVLDAGRALASTCAALPGWAHESVRNSSVRRGVVAAAQHTDRPAPRPLTEPTFFDTVFRVIDADDWRRGAARSKGTANSLLVEVAANIVRASASGRAEVRVGVPSSLRGGPDDDRANALLVAPVVLPGGPPRHADCHANRAAVKAALTATTRQGATLLPDSAWSLLPNGWAQRFKTPGAQFTDVVASNFGAAPGAAVRFAGRDASSLFVRTMNVPGVRTDRSPLRASLCLVEAGGRYHLTVTAAPTLFGGHGQLADAVDRELRAWQVRPRPWPGTHVRGSAS